MTPSNLFQWQITKKNIPKILVLHWKWIYKKWFHEVEQMPESHSLVDLMMTPKYQQIISAKKPKRALVLFILAS